MRGDAGYEYQATLALLTQLEIGDGEHDHPAFTCVKTCHGDNSEYASLRFREVTIRLLKVIYCSIRPAYVYQNILLFDRYERVT